MGPPPALVPWKLVLVTGRLEIKSAHDGWVDAVIVSRGGMDRISLECTSAFTRSLRENALCEVMACGRLHFVDGQRTLRVEWLRRG